MHWKIIDSDILYHRAKPSKTIDSNNVFPEAENLIQWLPIPALMQAQPGIWGTKRESARLLLM